jgi:curved DNA-binding protein CbpA
MTVDEALKLLGLKPDATAADIKAAHRRLMKQVHPDTGGSAYLAARVNEAKDILLNR